VEQVEQAEAVVVVEQLLTAQVLLVAVEQVALAQYYFTGKDIL
jgi:hypothetical protein